jgi:putative redox protein
MVKTKSEARRYRTIVTNGHVETTADTTKGGVGSLEGFRPHELLEAAVAACMGISARLKADELGLGSVEISTEVSLDRSAADRAVFWGRVTVRGAGSDAERAALEDAAFHCAVSQTLRRECVLMRTDGPCDDRGVATVSVRPRGGLCR